MPKSRKRSIKRSRKRSRSAGRPKGRSAKGRSPSKIPLKLYKSSTGFKKFDVYVPNKKTGNLRKVSFGDRRYEDYTIHKDKERMMRYRQRHRLDKINNPMYAGFWSYWVLWGDTTSLSRNMAAAKKRARK